MLVMLMFSSFFCEIINADLLLCRIHLLISETENLVGLDTMISVLNKFLILHHFVNIFRDPWLFSISRIHTHVTKKLLFSEGLQIFRENFYLIFTNDLVDDQGPF